MPTDTCGSNRKPAVISTLALASIRHSIIISDSKVIEKGIGVIGGVKKKTLLGNGSNLIGSSSYFIPVSAIYFNNKSIPMDPSNVISNSSIAPLGASAPGTSPVTVLLNFMYTLTPSPLLTRHFSHWRPFHKVFPAKDWL